jgi:hypothetical protein
MQSASLSAKRPAITAAEMFEMQNQDPRILKIASKLMLRPRGLAHAR